MASIDEKRVYDDRTGAETVLVATGAGLATVSVSGDVVGEFGLARRCDARDVAARDGRVALATADDLRLGPIDGLAATGFGPAVAVGFDGDDLLAAGPDGRVARFRDGDAHRPGEDDEEPGDDDSAWTDLGTVEGAVRAVDGDLVAAGGGVYRAGDDLRHAGLAAVRDVAAPGVPHAATDDGLYRLGNGWLDARDGAFRVVAADAADAEPGRLGRAHAATGDAFLAHRDGEWRQVELPADGPVADVAHGDATYAVTEAGTLCVDAGDGWRSRSLGLSDVGGLAVL